MRTRIRATRIVTGHGTVLSDAAILIEDGTIQQVDSAENVPTDVDESYDFPGYTVLPGLIDAHTHITSTDLSLTDVTMRSPTEIVVDTLENLRTTVQSGVTTIRDVGSHADVPIVLGDSIDQGKFTGPSIVACGQGLTTTGGHGTSAPWHVTRDRDDGIAYVADGVAEVRRGVREQVHRGAGAVKAWVTGGAIDQSQGRGMQFSRDEVVAIADEAQRNEVYAAAHAHYPAAIRACAEAGFRSIEHGMYVDADSLDVMIENGTYLSLTTEVMRAAADDETVPEPHRTNAAEALDNLKSRLPDALDDGLNVGLGAEAGAPLVPHGQNRRELASLVELGLEPLDVIEIATRQNAEMIGISKQVGTLEAGKVADLIAVDGNPLDDIAALTADDQVEFVMVEGNPVVDPM